MIQKKGRKLRKLLTIKTDLRLLVGYLKVCQEKENLLQFIRDNEEEFATIEEDTYDAIVALSGNEELKKNVT